MSNNLTLQLTTLLCSSAKGKARNHFAWTTLSHGAKGWWNSARGTVIRIEVLVVLVAGSMVLLTLIGSWRRRSQNFVAQKVVQAIYISSSSLAIYSFGSMQSSPIKSGMFPFLAMSLFVLSSSADCITAFSLDDTRQLMAQPYYQAVLSVFYVGLIAYTILGGANALLGLLFFELSGFAFLKWWQRQLACRFASGSWFLNKMVADYMYQEQEQEQDEASSSFYDYDPASMRGYHYLVDWAPLLFPRDLELEADTFYAFRVKKEAAGAFISIDKIWQCESLSSAQKDLCLSFSLFHLLRRRFFGFPCAESSSPRSRKKMLDFVLEGLLKKNNKQQQQRVFKVIQVELAFMYDFFFTRYATIYYTLPWPQMVSVATSLVTFAAAACAVSAICPPTSSDHIVFTIRNGFPVAAFDLLITVAMLACTCLLELVQMLFYWTTIWGRVYVACRSVRLRRAAPAPDTRRASCVLMFLDTGFKILFWIPTFISNNCNCWFDQENRCYWQNKLGQYSLLESVPYSPSNKPSPDQLTFLEVLINLGRWLFLAKTWLISPAIADINRWRVDKPGTPIDLTEQVKEAVVQSLQRSQGILTNGESSLFSNGAPELVWACRQEDMIRPADSGTSSSQKKEKLQVLVILTWHIATGYCEMATPRVGTEFKHHFDVATTLSKYCAYLLLKRPNLLPGHQYDTRRVFDKVAAEAIASLQGEKNKYSAMARLTTGSGETKENIFHKGVRLGRQLEEMEEGKRWKVLADFWAEMLLYIAPSDNVEEHVKCLAEGGEFITHLWALLTHAGILDRGERNVPNDDIENQPGTSGNHTAVQSAGMVQQQANLVHNVGGTPSASAAPTEIEEIQ